MRDAFLEEEYPDLTVYRYRNGAEIVLTLNEDNTRPFIGKVKLPVTGNVVRYDPWDNKLLPVTAEKDESVTSLSLDLAPLELCVILIGKQKLLPAVCAKPGTNYTAVPLTNFTVSRCTAKEYPAFHDVETPDLENGMQTLHPEFSGFYRYETVFTIDSPDSCLLTIEDVGESAEVFVNGNRVGMRTAQPYCFDLTSALKPGENTFVIEVATNLERKVFAMGLDPAAMGIPSPLSPTGIIGTVTLSVGL